MTLQNGPFTIVLLGMGHTHLHVLRSWQKNPIKNTRLVCISNQEDSAYSGMLPGVLAGDYAQDAMKIDLQRRCQTAKAELILGETTECNLKDRFLSVEGYPTLHYDLLSVGVGSRPATIPGDDSACSIKPMQTFLTRLSQHLSHAVAGRTINKTNPLNVVIIGGGAGGVEVALCLPNWLHKQLGSWNFQVKLVHRGSQILEGAADRTVHLVTRTFNNRSIQLYLQHDVLSVDKAGVKAKLASGDTTCINGDVVITAVGAVAPKVLDQFHVTKDDRGFVLTNSFLLSIDDESLFVVGDSGTQENHRVAKAGVYAVRQGPILRQNLASALANRPLKAFTPQQDFLWLLNTGDRRAILQYRGYALHAKWCWWLKHWIDTKFIHKHQQYAR